HVIEKQTVAEHHTEQGSKYRTVERKPALQRRTLGQSDHTLRVAAANGGDCLVQDALGVPSPRNFLLTIMDGIWKRLPLIDHIRGRPLKELAQGDPHGLADLCVVERLDHVAHPRIPLLTTDLEAQMRFAQADPPAPLRV